MKKEQYILFVNAHDTDMHKSSANTSIYPNLGLLTLMSSLKPLLEGSNLRLGYFDGAVYGNEVIEKFIDEHPNRIFSMCFSTLTANYGASIALATRAKDQRPDILTIFGNDHFSALYQQAMSRQSSIDFGFYGNDVVEGFTHLMVDMISGNPKDLSYYPGLVYRNDARVVRKNSENPKEYGRLPSVDYSLVDSFIPHQNRYLDGQQATYFFMKDRKLSSQVVDIGRGCIKFAGTRLEGIPANVCDFCGIVPGAREIASHDATRAWDILKSVYEQGFNYFYITADELPLTLWPMLSSMAERKPDWFNNIPDKEKPRMFGYARAEAFGARPERIDTLTNILGFDHFFIGFDGLTDVSLQVMNKQPVDKNTHNLMNFNLRAIDRVVQNHGMITAGIVLTHLGITPEIMQENYEVLSSIVRRYPHTFAALDFGPLCPIPGSHTFRYLTHPEYAESRAKQFGLRIDRDYLEANKEKYQHLDEFRMDGLIRDFNHGCCPDISTELVDKYIGKITDLAIEHNIVVGGGV